MVEDFKGLTIKRLTVVGLGAKGGAMRSVRILGEPGAAANYYHVMSRILEGRFLLEGPVKEKFREFLEIQCGFAGVELLCFCIMSNHVHLLIEVPNAEEHRAAIDDAELLRRLALVTTSEEQLIGVRQMLARLKEQSPEKGYLEYRQRFLNRMADLSMFVKELKQRFTQWYNKKVQRKGPLWEDRFKSVLLENDETVLLTMATYIDLNPVRAGIVKDPKDYRWSSYGEAVAGNKARRRGLMRVLGIEHGSGHQWRSCQAQYRRYLYGVGEEQAAVTEEGGKRRAGMPGEAVAKVERQGGQLNVAQVVRVRVRYFSDSLALGSEAFVEEVFARHREQMQVKRERGARSVKTAGMAGWRGLVDLRNRRPVA